MPSITFVNMDGDSKSFDLEKTSNQDALLGGFNHLDKSIESRKLSDQEIKEQQRLDRIADQQAGYDVMTEGGLGDY